MTTHTFAHPTPGPNRFGLHYFPDHLHYRQADLHTWLPHLKGLGCGWLTLLSAPDRAIPEFFLRTLLQEGIQPIVHFNLPMHANPKQKDLHLILEQYARWGVRFVCIFDSPNARTAWPAAAWSRAELVERFLDSFIPLAQRIASAGMLPVFPPLQPGGDYWDTAFLYAALKGLQRRATQDLLSGMALGAYAWAGNHPLNWGAGGPERWPKARPYTRSLSTQDHMAFRIFDWYLAIARSVFGVELPILLMRAGSRLDDASHPNLPAIELDAHTRANFSLIQSLANAPEIANLSLEPISQRVLACNFWLLSTAPTSPHKKQAWFQPDGSHLPIVDRVKNWLASAPVDQYGTAQAIRQPISHYLLLPSFEWGVADWHLEAIRPYVKKYRPTIGFSTAEARLAQKVTVVGEYELFPDDIVEQLLSAGCIVEQIRASGTELAQIMSDR
jgi:hypothetical protein